MRRALTIITALGILGLLIFFHTRGLVIGDDGWIINLSSRLYHGEVIYKDFEFVYTPGVIYVTSLGYFLFGQSILSERIIALINSLTSVGILYLILRQLKIRTAISYLVILTYLAWGPTHINFVWPIMFNITFTFCIIYFLNRWEIKNDLKFIFLAGIFSGLNILFKQNFGAAGILIFLVFLLTNRKTWNLKLLLSFIGGAGLVGIGQLAYFNATSSLSYFISDMNFILIQKFIKEGLAAARWPWEYPGPLIYRLIKAIFYLSPLGISAASMFYVFKKYKNILFIPFFAFVFYCISIKPTPDFVHLTGLLAICGLPLALIYKYSNNNAQKLVSIALFLFLIILGFYTAIFTNYYRWDPKILTDNYYSSNPRIRIFLNKTEYDQINSIDNFVWSNSKNGDYIYAHFFYPAFYFTSDRRSPIKYDYSSPQLYTSQIEREIISNLKIKNVKVLITDADTTGDTTSVGIFLKKN